MTVQSSDVLKELEKALQVYFRLVMKKSLEIDGDLSLTHSELEILSIVAAAEGGSITDIAREADMSTAGASLLVSKLEKKGTVSKATSPRKKSQVSVRLTRLGRKACRVHDQYHARHNEVILGYLHTLEHDDLEKSHEFARFLTRWMQSFYDEATGRSARAGRRNDDL